MRLRRGVGVLAVVAAAVVGTGPADAVSLLPGEEVRVAQGTLRGKLSLDHREFLGIPFAAPPTGAARFAAPRPAAGWSGVRDATRSGSACAQTLPSVGSLLPSAEDCLTLDVHVPPLHRSRRLPVIVYLYGGAYSLGSAGGYDPEPLVTRGDVVVVTVNYRLGPFGFLTLPGSQANNGLLDQQAGLRWVRDNVAAFGGDPSNVTLAGQSAGGNSVCHQLASPGAAGLFHKAIVMSGACTGSALAPFPRADAERRGAAYAAAVGCPDAAAALACLRGRTQAELLAGPGVAFEDLDAAFRPVVDGDVVPRPLTESLRTGAFAQVPTMIGATKDEGTLFVALQNHVQNLGPVTPDEYEAFVRARFGADAAAVLAEYPLSAYPSPDLAYAAVVTDSFFACPAGTTARAVAAAGPPVYRYELAEPDPPLSGADPFMPMGAFHASDATFLFTRVENVPVPPLLPRQQRLREQLVRYWTAFARTGSPATAADPAWPATSGPDPGLQRLLAAGTTTVPAAAADAAHHCGLWAAVDG